MHEALTNNTFLVKEHVALFKASNNFDILEPESGHVLMECREENLGLLTKIFRFTDYKRLTPFDLHIRSKDGRQVLRVKRGISFFLSTVEVFDEDDVKIGSFKQKLFSIGGAFDVRDENDQPICHLQGKWTGWNFKFASDTEEYAHVTKKWNGLGKEFLTSADSYVLNISDSVPAEDKKRGLIMAAVMCIDMVLKE